MKTTVTLSDFRDAFRSMGRSENFSYEGLELLFDYFEQYEQDSGEEMELDVIAICCDFYEMDPTTINDEYSLDLDLSDMYEAEAAEAVAEALNEQTSVVGTTSAGTVVFQAF